MFVMRPVIAGYITFDKVVENGALSASDILLMNQTLDVIHETERRHKEKQKGG